MFVPKQLNILWTVLPLDSLNCLGMQLYQTCTPRLIPVFVTALFSEIQHTHTHTHFTTMMPKKKTKKGKQSPFEYIESNIHIWRAGKQKRCRFVARMIAIYEAFFFYFYFSFLLHSVVTVFTQPILLFVVSFSFYYTWLLLALKTVALGVFSCRIPFLRVWIATFAVVRNMFGVSTFVLIAHEHSPFVIYIYFPFCFMCFE